MLEERSNNYENCVKAFICGTYKASSLKQTKMVATLFRSTSLKQIKIKTIKTISRFRQ